ncbi:MAG: hypothetical protein ACKVIR_04375 [Candidatus Poseidoniales archaeon]
MSLSIEESEIQADETLWELKGRLLKNRLMSFFSMVPPLGVSVLFFLKEISIIFVYSSFTFFIFTILSLLKRKSIENEFIEQFDMTEMFDVSDKDLRFAHYQRILAKRIREKSMTIVPVLGRASDKRGPDWGKTDFKMGHEPERRDAIKEGNAFIGLEGELTEGEKMVAGADEVYAKYAQKRWERAETNDPDIVEYGVERLGDLVKTDYFEKNAEEGVFSKAAKLDEESG